MRWSQSLEHYDVSSIMEVISNPRDFSINLGSKQDSVIELTHAT